MVRARLYYVVLERRGSRAFTLIELLVVLAVVSLLLAILLPALNKARILANRIACRKNLKEIACAWHMYLDDHDGAFYQGVNANVLYGGWAGTNYPNHSRPLNGYLRLPPTPGSESQAKVFRCPCDEGRRGVPWYSSVGTSYQTNTLLIGQDRRGWLPIDIVDEINKELPNLNRRRVDNHSLLVLIGDYGWANCWEPRVPRIGDWHGRRCWHNVAFLDGHVDFIRIRKGIYVADEYTVLPFKNLYDDAYAGQVEEPCE